MHLDEPSPRSLATATIRVDGNDHTINPAAARLVLDASSPHTSRAYRSDWNTWLDWCAEHRATPLPADPARVVDYIADRLDTGISAATVTRAMAAMRRAHLIAGHASPTEHPLVALATKGMRRTRSVDPDQATPINLGLLERITTEGLRPETNTQIRLRDHCLVVLGWWTALRRCDLAAIDIEDLCFGGTDAAPTMTLRVWRTKTEHAGHIQGHTRVRPGWVDPIAVTKRWLLELAFAGIRTGPLFRPVDALGRIDDRPLHPASVSTIVKKLVERTGTDASSYSAHSLRAGFVTTARQAGVPDHVIMERTRHRRIDTLATYTRLGDAVATGEQIATIVAAAGDA